MNGAIHVARLGFVSGLQRYLATYRRRPALRFVFWITAEGLVVAGVVAVILVFALQLPGRTDIDLQTFKPSLIFSAVLVGPLIETLILQCLPVIAAQSLRWNFLGQFIASIVLFAAAHFVVAGVATGISAGIVSGAYFGFTYVHWSQKSYATAYALTALSHGLHN